ncbi:hypothetical protein J3F83DRAFT_740457 [Trichoderma novae-zelandiae]
MKQVAYLTLGTLPGLAWPYLAYRNSRYPRFRQNWVKKTSVCVLSCFSQVFIFLSHVFVSFYFYCMPCMYIPLLRRTAWATDLLLRAHCTSQELSTYGQKAPK